MGQQQITEGRNTAEMRTFTKALLEDARALERMLEEGLFETGVRRIGAEQEMFLVDGALKPAKLALRMLERLPRGKFTTELGLFNLEANLSPLELTGDFLSSMERELNEVIGQVREAARDEGARVVLCGILPTLDKKHLSIEYMTPNPRYLQLNNMMVALRGGQFDTLIKGVDELQTSHDNVMLEACNTSFQIHFQVGAAEFPKLYNLAQVVTAPVLAAAVNSPVLLRHRLWHETRVALFQQSLDTRSKAMAARGSRQRVSFGDTWVRESVMEIFREDIARFRSLISIDAGESPLRALDRGEMPALNALRLHNGTVYRWNRPCYGVQGNKAHLRIENRVLPAGPTVVDEVANAAFYFGLMCALGDEYGDVTQVMNFDDAKANFIAAARYGPQARFRWLRGRPCGADELILQHLLPLARQGLESRNTKSEDIDRSLGVIEERLQSGRTGAQWALDSLSAMGTRGRAQDRYRSLTEAIIVNQETEKPVHEWGLAELQIREERESYRTVEQVMTTDLFTVGPEDIVDLAASLMEWEHIRHVPVEDSDGHLVGLVSHRALLRMLARGDSREVAVSEVMKRDVVTVNPDTSIVDAIQMMRERKLGCLPVVRDERLVGIVTEHDFIEVSHWLLERWLRAE